VNAGGRIKVSGKAKVERARRGCVQRSHTFEIGRWKVMTMGGGGGVRRVV